MRSSTSTAVLATVATTLKVATASWHYGMSEFTLPDGIWPPASNTTLSNAPYQQAIFLTFDGMHQFDLLRLIAENPGSSFARIVNNGITYSQAMTSSPSDSLPATASIYTGAAPRTHGVFWEQMYDRALYTGGTDCQGPIGGICDYSEACDLNNTLITGGNAFNLTYLPHQKTTWGTCVPVLPHDFLRVNTIFEVARGNGIYTAFADKHLSYQFMNGPSGTGLSEGYFPEISSIGNSLEANFAWDDLHWSALANWTNDCFTNGTMNPAGGPRLYAANFQAITWAQQNAGYLDGAGTPNKSLATAFQMADQRLGDFLTVLDNAGKLDSTLLLVGSKQGQGPINPKTLHVEGPNSLMTAAGVPVSFFNAEDGGIMYLKNPHDAPKAKANLLANKKLGISYVLAGDEVQAAGFGSPYLDSRVPDLIIGAKVGTLWNDGFEFEDHGGFGQQDLHVPLVAYNPGLQAQNITQMVSVRSVASTMLQALGLPVSQLQGYSVAESPVLPGLFGSCCS